jgi:spore coat protein A
MSTTPSKWLGRAVAIGAAAAVTLNCGSGDDNIVAPGGDAGGGDASVADSSLGDGGTDAGHLDAGGDSTVDSGRPDAGDGGNGEAAAGEAGPTVPVEQVALSFAKIPKYVDPVPTFTGKRVSGADGGLTVEMDEFQQKILPESVYAGLPAPFSAGTYQWGYNVASTGPSWPATTIEVQRHTPTTITYVNNLQGPNGAHPVLQRYLIVDQAVHWADPLKTTENNGCVNGPPLAGPCLQPYSGPVPVTVHLHGHEVPSQFDGHPDSWFTPGLAQKGPGFFSNIYTYPNGQEATALWFHDHALGVVRLNVYSGLAGFYLIRDPSDTGLAGNPLNLPAGPFEQELLMADRQFDTNGQLYFPNGVQGNSPGLNGPPPNPDFHPFWTPEFFGDVMTVNGKSWPYLEVQPRRYRFRVLNGSNARFLHMILADSTAVDAGLPAPDGAVAPPPPGLTIWQIGSDGGFFNAPVALDPAVQDDLYTNFVTNELQTQANPVNRGLFLAPAERADIIVDFGGQEGRTFTLVNDGIAPFPSGGTNLDPDGNGQIMQFRVDQPLADGGTDTTFNPAAPTGDAGAGPLRAQPIVDIKTITPSKTRQLVLVEVEGAISDAPVEVLLNNSHWAGTRELEADAAIPGSTSNGEGLNATETPQIGSTEVWEVANLTADAHPIHVHLIQFQMVNRQPLLLNTATPPADQESTQYRVDWYAAFPGGTFGGNTYDPGTFIPGYGPPMPYATVNADGALGGNIPFNAGGGAYFGGPALPPEPEEAGWKDTIKMLPGWVTRIAIRWAPQDVPLTGAGAAAPGTNSFTFDPTAVGPDAGPGYVWHCHIIDHEDNEMMRPMLIAK